MCKMGWKELPVSLAVLFTHQGNFYRMYSCAIAKKGCFGALTAGQDPAAAIGPGPGSGVRIRARSPRTFFNKVRVIFPTLRTATSCETAIVSMLSQHLFTTWRSNHSI